MLVGVSDLVISNAPNGEDVVLLRALGHVPTPRYLELCSAQALDEGWSQALDAAGWIGSHIVLSAGSGDAADGVSDALASLGSGRHAVWLSVPDLARAVFSATVGTHRPWIVVAAVTDEPECALSDAAAAAAAGYSRALFDGVSVYYVASEHAQLMPALSYPRCSRDVFVTSSEHRLRGLNDSLLRELVHWRATALVGWADALASHHLDEGAPPGELARLSDELTAIRSTLSWRVTRPLRAARRRLVRPDARS